MCGRFAKYTPNSAVARRYFGVQISVGDVIPHYNASPGSRSQIIRSATGNGYQGSGYDFDVALWNFKKEEAGPQANVHINARAETVATKTTFAHAFHHQRCVVPIDGWYEWVKGWYRQPYYITRLNPEQDEVLFLAGLWSRNEELRFAVITEPAAPHLRMIHDRQPVVLSEDSVKDWLDPQITSREAIRGHIKRLPPEELVYWPVSTEVNNVANNHPGLIQPIMM